MTARWMSDAALRWLDRLVVAELVALTFLLGCTLGRDMDIWWHLRAGREMLAGGGIPRVDAYLFSGQDLPWIDLHWGFQVVAAWLYDRAGFVALTLATATLAALAMAIALAATLRRGAWAPLVWCWLPAVFVMSARFYARPEIVSLVCLAATLWILRRADDQPRALWLLVPLQVVWVNVQGLFILGPVLLACWLLGRVSSRTPTPDASDRWHVWAAPAAAIAACLVNPYGWRGAVFPLTLFRRMSSEGDFYGAHIGELRSIPDVISQTGFSSLHLRLALLLLVAAAASFALAGRPWRDRAGRLAMFVTFAGVGLLAIRNQPQFALVAGAVLAWNVGDWFASRPMLPRLERTLAGLLTSAVLVGLMAWVATGGFYRAAGDGRRVGVGEHPQWHAHDAAIAATREDMPRRFVAFHEGQAAVLEFHMRPDQRVFVDPRLEVTPRDALARYYAVAEAMREDTPAWREMLAALPQPLGLLVDHATYPGIEATLLVDPQWRCVWFDAVAGVYAQTGMPVDFAARLFSQTSSVGQAAGAGSRQGHTATDTGRDALAALHLAESYLHVGQALLAKHVDAAPLGQVQMLLAIREARDAVSSPARAPRVDLIVAAASAALYGTPDGTRAPDGWELEDMLGVARVRYLLGHTSSGEGADFRARLALFASAQALGDPHAMRVAGERLLEIRARTAADYDVQRRVRAVLGAARPNPVAVSAIDDLSGADVAAAPRIEAALSQARELIARRQFLRAREVLARAVDDRASAAPVRWQVADLYARLLLLHGEPARARAAWSSQSGRAPDAAAVQRGIAASLFVQGRLEEAAAAYRAALAEDTSNRGAHRGLVLTYLERGDATRFLAACEDGHGSDAESGPMLDLCHALGPMAVPHREPRAATP